MTDKPKRQSVVRLTIVAEVPYDARVWGAAALAEQIGDNIALAAKDACQQYSPAGATQLVSIDRRHAKRKAP